MACNGQKNYFALCNGNSGFFHALIFVGDSELKGIVWIIIGPINVLSIFEMEVVDS